MLDDFAHLQAEVSVLSMYKVGYAVMFGRLDVLDAFSTNDIFKLQWISADLTPL